MASNVYTGAKLFPWQKAVAVEICDQKGTGKVVVCKSHRQAGKSLMCENILLYYAINYPRTRNAIISPVLSQSRKVFREIVNAIIETGIIQKKNETLLELTLINGSMIIFRSAEMKDTLRGETINGILIWDEAAYLNEQVAELTLPWLQVHKSPLLIVSTPKIKDGLFWLYWNQGLTGEGNVVSIDWNDFDTSALLSEEIKEQYKKILTPNQYKSEILGEWLDDEGMVFSHFKECVEDNMIQPTDRLYVGIDYAAGGGESHDYTVISMFNQDGKQVFLDYWNTGETNTSIDRLVRDIEPYKKQIVLIQPELNSIGTPLTDILKTRLQTSNIIGFNTTNKSKSDLVGHLQVAFQNEEIRILSDKQQLNQLGTYAAEYNFKTKTITYNAPNGLHDDICMSLMLAYDAYRQYKVTGYYKVGVIRGTR